MVTLTGRVSTRISSGSSLASMSVCRFGVEFGCQRTTSVIVSAGLSRFFILLRARVSLRSAVPFHPSPRRAKDGRPRRKAHLLSSDSLHVYSSVVVRHTPGGISDAAPDDDVAFGPMDL